jgi:hypothetical protein
MADDGWKGGTDPQAYVDSLKQDALTMVEQVEATQDDINAAQRICGLPADPAHIQADKVVQAFRDHRIAAEARGMAEIERLRHLLQEYLDAEEIDDPATRMEELAVCRQLARAALNGGQHE